MWENDFRRLMTDYLEERRSKNGRFSMRALAKKVQVSPSTLSDLLSGTRHVSAATALSILEKIPDADAVRLADVTARLNRQNMKRIPLAADSYDLILEWSYLGILCVLELHDAPTTAVEIAERLGLQKEKTERALRRLTDLGMIKKTSTGYAVEQAYFETTDEIPNQKIVQAHLSDLQRGAEAVRAIPYDRRDFVSLTVSGDTRKLAVVKRLSRRFLSQVGRAFGGERHDEVYRVAVQIYPLTEAKGPK